MNKLKAFIVLAMMAFTFAACDRDKGSGGPVDQPPPVDPPPTDTKPNVTLVTLSLDKTVLLVADTAIATVTVITDKGILSVADAEKWNLVPSLTVSSTLQATRKPGSLQFYVKALDFANSASIIARAGGKTSAPTTVANFQNTTLITTLTHNSISLPTLIYNITFLKESDGRYFVEGGGEIALRGYYLLNSDGSKFIRETGSNSHWPEIAITNKDSQGRVIRMYSSLSTTRYIVMTP